MSGYDQTFDPKVVLGHCDLISRFRLILPYILAVNWNMNIFLSQYVCFDPKVVLVLGHCDLISWLGDFALYLDNGHSVGLFSYFFQFMNAYLFLLLDL